MRSVLPIDGVLHSDARATRTANRAPGARTFHPRAQRGTYGRHKTVRMADSRGSAGFRVPCCCPTLAFSHRYRISLHPVDLSRARTVAVCPFPEGRCVYPSNPGS
jgi:hypothetical protein